MLRRDQDDRTEFITGSSGSPISSGTLLGGCHTSRDTLAAITATGFEITSVQRFRSPESRLPQPAAPHVLGVAHRPSSG